MYVPRAINSHFGAAQSIGRWAKRSGEPLDIVIESKGRPAMSSVPPRPVSAADPQALLEAGLAASQANEVSQALDLFGQASAAAPSWAIPHFLIGSEHAALGEMDKAEAAIANAVLLDPGLHIARYQLGLLQYSSGRVAVALVTWQPLTELEVEQGLPEFVRGFAALAQDQMEAAKRHFAAGLLVDDVNAVVAGDIRKVLGGLQSVDAGAVTDFKVEAQLRIAPSAHVLVSTYDKYRLH
jgi:tetratricopeptide (TPR) repeat protein